MTFRVDNLSAGYQKSPIIKNLSFTLNAGELAVVAGPNGSGKTTLLRACARALPLLGGSIHIEDRSIETMKPREFARYVAYVPQESPPAMGFTVFEMVMMGRYPYQQGVFGESASDREAVEQAMERAGATPFSYRPFEQLSGGEKQRVLIARALAQNAPFLLLDEPTAHLDLRHQASLLTQLKQWVKEQGMGALCALHDLNLAAEYADKTLLMKEGHLMAMGAPQETLTAERLEEVYQTPVVVKTHPLNGRPLVFALTSEWQPIIEADAPRLHIIGGGGAGAPLFYPLLERGWQVTTGVNNLMDTDEEVARSLGLDQATESPFSPISASAAERAYRLIDQSEFVIMADIPFGFGNLENLKLVRRALESGKQVAAISAGNIEARDFTNGEALNLWSECLDLGLQVVTDFSDVLEWLQLKRTTHLTS